jgi:hypothetical protein
MKDTPNSSLNCKSNQVKVGLRYCRIRHYHLSKCFDTPCPNNFVSCKEQSALKETLIPTLRIDGKRGDVLKIRWRGAGKDLER